MKKALIVDWLDKYGGAERVIGAFERIFSFDITYTLTNIMLPDDLKKIYPQGNPQIRETAIKKLGRKFRMSFFVFHYFINRITIDNDVELIISSSHAIAKGIRKSNPKQLHISYFQARNFNYIWSDYELYFGKYRYLIFPIVYFLRKIDLKQAKNPDYIVSNSIFVQQWVKEKYQRDSIVIYPPVALHNFPLQEQKEEYYVAVGRLVSVKRFDLAIKVFNENKKRLIIIGDGDQAKNLRKMAGPNITFTGFLDSKEVGNYIRNAKGFIQTGIEGFGIAPIEAQSCGTPVVAFAKGGVLETVINNKTGIFFYNQTVTDLSRAITDFESTAFDPNLIRAHALTFSSERFEVEIKQFVEDKWRLHANR